MKINKLIGTMASIAVVTAVIALPSQAMAQKCNLNTLKNLDYKLVLFDGKGKRLKDVKIPTKNIDKIQDYKQIYTVVYPEDIKGYEKIRSKVARFGFVSKNRLRSAAHVESEYAFNPQVEVVDGEKFVFSELRFKDTNRKAETQVRVTQKMPNKHRKTLDHFGLTVTCPSSKIFKFD